MQINLRAKNFELTQEIKDYVDEKIGKLDRFLEGRNGMGEVDLILEAGHHRQGKINGCKVLLHIPGHKIFVEEWHEEMFGAIDLAEESAKRQIEKYDHPRKSRGWKSLLKRAKFWGE